jgi:hypothetical protein
MKRFLTKVSIFILLPFISWGIIEALLPVTTFTYRHWEAISFKTKIPAINNLYPNIKSSMAAEGDLCHHTNNSILKNETFITDKLGYRNDTFIDNADIIFLGDSFAGGCSLNQNDLISYRVKARCNNAYKIYNMAPGSFSTFDRLIKTGVIKKPKLIIFCSSERSVPERIVPYHLNSISKIKNAVNKMFGTGNINVYIDKALKQFSIEWIRARIHQYKGVGIPSYKDPRMFFLNGADQQYPQKDLYETESVILSYKKYCDSSDINFMFIPMPNKETVYYELVPFKKQPDYLFQLDSLLRTANVETINALKIYNNFRDTSQAILYHRDDTHWNGNATDLISKEIVKKINAHAGDWFEK